mmetsp:Transcript_120861/g.222249  ORF Transcript_120861/g.222249 Transcript_120861/m.222249 type:complete len:233 (-) Transcript_120861:369-1067(-)
MPSIRSLNCCHFSVLLQDFLNKFCLYQGQLYQGALGLVLFSIQSLRLAHYLRPRWQIGFQMSQLANRPVQEHTHRWGHGGHIHNAEATLTRQNGHQSEAVGVRNVAFIVPQYDRVHPLGGIASSQTRAARVHASTTTPRRGREQLGSHARCTAPLSVAGHAALPCRSQRSTRPATSSSQTAASSAAWSAACSTSRSKDVIQHVPHHRDCQEQSSCIVRVRKIPDLLQQFIVT